MQKRLEIHPERCIGCRSCEVSCALENVGLMATSHARIVLISLLEKSGQSGSLPVNYPVVCRQCADAPCREVCPENAVAVDPEQGDCITISSELCTGCAKCIRACPFGAIHLDPDTRLAVKCELCSGEPACEAVCPSGAIEFKTMAPYYSRIDAFKIEAAHMLRKRHKPLLKPSTGQTRQDSEKPGNSQPSKISGAIQ